MRPELQSQELGRFPEIMATERRHGRVANPHLMSKTDDEWDEDDDDDEDDEDEDADLDEDYDEYDDYDDADEDDSAGRKKDRDDET